MDAIASQLPSNLTAALALHLRKCGSKLTVAEAASAAIHAWIEQQAQDLAAPSQTADSPDPAVTRGYQWKDLFLPEGTQLRISSAGHTYQARVTGDHIVYQGRKVSPRGFTLATIGEGRNAWRDVWLKFAGQRHFLPASRCRREQQREPSPPPPQVAVPVPACADSLNAAVLTMAEALSTTLALMERVKARALAQEERRVRPPRREIDVMAGDCAFD